MKRSATQIARRLSASIEQVSEARERALKVMPDSPERDRLLERLSAAEADMVRRREEHTRKLRPLAFR